MTTLAGTPGQSNDQGVDGAGANARFTSVGPAAIWGDGANLYAVDRCVIRKIVLATREVTTFSGAQVANCVEVDGSADAARFRSPESIWGDGLFLYVVERPVTPIRFGPGVPGSIRVISLVTGDVRTIPIPLVSSFVGIQRPLGIWGLDGYLYTTWFSRAGTLSFARINTATNAAEWLFSSSPVDCCSGFSPAGLWFDGRGSFYFLENATVRRLDLSTGALTSIATAPPATYGSPAGLWGAGDNLFVADSQGSIVSRVRISTGESSVFAGLQSNAPRADARATASSEFVNGAWSDGSNLFIIVDNNILRVSAATNTTTVLATLAGPRYLWGDGTYLYTSDVDNGRIQRIALSSGIVTTLASGLTSPRAIWGDSTNLYVTDGSVVRRIVKATGEASIVAGAAGQRASVDGVGADARFLDPVGIWGDGTHLYISDSSDYTIRKVRISTSEVSTFAGSSRQRGYVDGPGAQAHFDTLSGISGDGTYLYVGDFGNNVLRKVTIATGEVSGFMIFPGNPFSNDGRFLYVRTSIGNVLNRIALATGELSRTFPSLQFSEGAAPSDRIPVSVSWGDSQYLYGFFGTALYKVRTATGEITHVAGALNDYGLVDGTGNGARFSSPTAIWGDGNYLYVLDGVIRRVELATRRVTTLLGGLSINSRSDIWSDGSFLYVTTVVASTSEGGLRAIDRISLATGEVVRVAGDLGTVGSSDFKDGAGTAARFRNAGPMWGDGGNLYVGDGCSIRTVALASTEVTTFVGIPDVCGHVDGGRQAARFNTITDIWSNGSVLFVSSPHTIRTLDLNSGEVRTIAGDPVMIGTENGIGPNARFLRPGRIWGDGAYLYVSDNGIRRISFARATQTYAIPASGAGYWTTVSSAISTTVGFGRVQPDAGSTALDGVAVFGFRANGVLVSEAAVPASPLIRQGRIYAESGGPVRIGIAIANPGNQSANVSFYFTGASGSTIGIGTTTVAANRQIAAFLNEAPFNATSDARSFTFTSSSPVAAIALRGYVNERSEFLMTTLPVAPLTSSAAGLTVLPHYAAGGGWQTQILLVNPTDDAIAGVVDMDSSYAYSIAPRSAVKIVSSQSASQVRTGNVRIGPAPNSFSPVASTVFSYTAGGVTVTESGVGPSGTAQAFRLFAEFDSEHSMQTGFAIANIAAFPAVVRLELWDSKGQPAGYSGSLNLPANGHLAMFLNEVPDFQNLPATFKGVLRISSDAMISVAGLRERYNERGDFLISTTPALADGSGASGAELVFPHIVTGGGYTTEFLLMGRGNVSEGTVLFRSQSGAELPLLIAR